MSFGHNKHTVLSAYAVLIKRMKCQLGKVKESSIRDQKKLDSPIKVGTTTNRFQIKIKLICM